MAKYDHLKETLYNFYKNNSHLGRKAIYNRFIELGAPKRTLNRWPVKLLQNKTLDLRKFLLLRYFYFYRKKFINVLKIY
jgi:hypothetical protein